MKMQNLRVADHPGNSGLRNIKIQLSVNKCGLELIPFSLIIKKKALNLGHYCNEIKYSFNHEP